MNRDNRDCFRHVMSEKRKTLEGIPLATSFRHISMVSFTTG